jgi:hypothetical protein
MKQSGNKDEISRVTVVSFLCGYFFKVIQESVVRNKLDIYFIFIVRAKTWLAQNQENVSELSDMSNHGLLFQ